MPSTPDEWQNQPRLRAADVDRQQAVESLTRAWREGRITRDEFQERSQISLAATFTDELDDVLSDLGGLSYYAEPMATPNATSGQLEVRDSWKSEHDDALPVQWAPEGATGSGLTVGFMSGMDRVGRWVVPANHVAVGFWGGAVIDLRDAVFTSPETTITCIGIMGGVDVIVPPEMDVHVTGVGFMGGFGWDKLRYATPTRTPSPDNPRVTINGLGFWGGVGVTRKERGEPID